jgi:hypothetical protein
MEENAYQGAVELAIKVQGLINDYQDKYGLIILLKQQVLRPIGSFLPRGAVVFIDELIFAKPSQTEKQGGETNER